MTDIVQRLRQDHGNLSDYYIAERNEAADEIERLREELHEAGDGDTWHAAWQRSELEIERLVFELKSQTDTINDQQAEIERLRAALEWHTQMCSDSALRQFDDHAPDGINDGCRRGYWESNGQRRTSDE